MAEALPFARRLINSGRLSQPCALGGLRLQSEDDPHANGAMAPGAACLDAPIRCADGRRGWLLDHLGGDFVLMSFGPAPQRQDVRHLVIADTPADGAETLADDTGMIAQRYGADNGGAYLIRPDQHVAARFSTATPEKIAAALERAQGATVA